jgi:hypothetical protein
LRLDHGQGLTRLVHISIDATAMRFLRLDTVRGCTSESTGLPAPQASISIPASSAVLGARLGM